MLRDPITAHGECFYACPGHRLFTSKFLAELANGWDGRSRLPRLQQRPFTRSDAAAAICGRRPQTSLEQAALVAGSTSKWKSVGNWMLHCAFASYGSSMPPGTQLTSPSWLQTSLGDFSLSLSLSLLRRFRLGVPLAQPHDRLPVVRLRSWTPLLYTRFSVARSAFMPVLTKCATSLHSQCWL